MPMMKFKIKPILRILVLLAAYGYVGFRIFIGGDLDFDGIFAYEFQLQHYFILVLTILLALLNWTLEIWKWKIAMATFVPVRFATALQAVLYGAGVGLFTPNRIGDPVGRVAMLPPAQRARGVAMAMVTSMSQQLATIVFGVVGIVLWLYQSMPRMIPFALLVGLTLVSLVLVMAIIFGHQAILRRVARFKPIAKLLKDEPLDVVASGRTLVQIVLLSLGRYVVFSSQLVLMMMLFGFDGDIMMLYLAIFISYLLSSVVPTVAIAEVGVKAGFAVIVVGTVWPNPLAITLASVLLWLVNVAIPALVGVWLPLVYKRD
jgi:hypothetical protein